METKRCSKCGEIKPVSEFNKENRKERSSKCRSQCKTCTKLYREANRDRIAKAHKKYQVENEEYFKQYRVIYNKSHNGQIKEQQKQHRIDNIEQYKERDKKYYKTNKEKIAAKKKLYAQINKEKVNKYARAYRKKDDYARLYYQDKMKNDIQFKLARTLRRRLYNAIENSSKRSSALCLLECSIDYLKHYLERQFRDNMSWDNYGLYGWHIDHIRPCASFDLTDPEQQKQCFHYSNLQPLWAKDNLSKSDKWEPLLSSERA